MKIVDWAVHPLDLASVPYNFSSSDSPLLHSAARALCLPARSSRSYLSLFPKHSLTPSRYATPSSSRAPEQAQLDKKYTGHILVSGYQISFVAPKEIPPKVRLPDQQHEDEPVTPVQLSKYRSRRHSLGGKVLHQFMVSIKMHVPYLSMPPRAPWLVRANIHSELPHSKHYF